MCSLGGASHQRRAAGQQADEHEAHQAYAEAVVDRGVGIQTILEHEHQRGGKAHAHAGDSTGGGCAFPENRTDQRDQHAAHQQVVGQGQGADDVIHDQSDAQYDDPGQQGEQAVHAQARLFTATQFRQQVFGQGGSSGEQAGAGGGHHRSQCRGNYQATDTVRQGQLNDGGEGVVDVVQVRNQYVSGHADQGAGQSVKDAVEACECTGDLSHFGALEGEHPLPDVLTDQDAEEVDHEVGNDRVPADGGEAEGARRQFQHQLIPTTDAVQADWQQDEHQAHGLDHELDDVGQGQRPHAADGRVDHHHATTEQYRNPERQAEQHLQHGANGQDRDHADHQRVRQHDHRARRAGHRVVAFFQHLGNGVDLQFQQRFGEEQVQRDDPATQCGAQPETGDAMDVAQAYGANGGRAAEYGGGHGAHVEARAEVTTGDQKVFVGLGFAHAIVAE